MCGAWACCCRFSSWGLGLWNTDIGSRVGVGWPYQCENPMGNFMAALRSFGHYAKPMEVFYLGRFVAIQDLPWHYAPVWLFITSPLPYVVLFSIGLIRLG